MDNSIATSMPRVDAIWAHPVFQEQLARIERLERDRIFCRHGLDHLLDVARLAWIGALEEGADLPRDLVYAAALLHDIGRAEEYASGADHDVAGEALAREILGTVDGSDQFSAQEQEAILAAVRGHRSQVAAALGDGGDATPPTVSKSGGGAAASAVLTPPAAGDPAVPETLARLIRTADKASRPCYACPARAACNWPDEKKNLSIAC